MRILFVAMSDSVHTARWISQIGDEGWDLHLFPSIDIGANHSGLSNIFVYHSFYGTQTYRNGTVKLSGINLISVSMAKGVRLALKNYFPRYRSYQLLNLINRLKPDIIHSMEFQAGGYLVADVKRMGRKRFPHWIASNWGSDIYLFGRLKEHEGKIREVLANCDSYACECQRDILLAQQMGFKGTVLPVLPNAGGFDLNQCSVLRTMPTSARKLILLKGYQTWSGRALVGLRAIALCKEHLAGYQVAIYVPSPDVQLAAEITSRNIGIPIVCIPHCSHEEMLKLFGSARIYIGLSISDAISTSLLEAIVMGAFPIQSCTACGDEWIQDGKTGFIVPPEDPEIIAQYLARAATDDHLVDQAAKLNYQTASDRLEKKAIQKRVIETYKNIFERL